MIVTRTLASVEIRTRTACRKEHKIARMIHRDQRPHVRGSGPCRAPVPPRSPRAVGAATWNRIPTPLERTGPGIKRSHDAARSVCAFVVGYRRACDHKVAGDRGRRSHVVLTRNQLSKPL